MFLRRLGRHEEVNYLFHSAESQPANFSMVLAGSTLTVQAAHINSAVILNSTPPPPPTHTHTSSLLHSRCSEQCYSTERHYSVAQVDTQLCATL
jgi:hypothetical protein